MAEVVEQRNERQNGKEEGEVEFGGLV